MRGHLISLAQSLGNIPLSQGKDNLWQPLHAPVGKAMLFSFLFFLRCVAIFHFRDSSISLLSQALNHFA